MSVQPALVSTDQQPIVVTHTGGDVLYKTVRGLALIQLIIGILSILLGVIAIFLSAWTGNIHQGIWCGVWILVTGIIGITSPRNPMSCCSGTYMAFSIVSTVVAFISSILFGVGISHYNNCYHYSDNPPYYWRCDESLVAAGLGMNIPFLILMITEFMVSLAAAVYSCKSTNCCANCCTQQQQFIVTAGQQQHTIAVSNQGQTAGFPVMVSYPAASYPTTTATGYYQPQYSGYPQQVGVMSAPGQMLSKPHTGAYHSPQGQPISASAVTNIVYSAQTTAPITNMAPPPYNSLT